MKKDNRVYGIDIIKILAVMLVLTLHFFLNTDYNHIPHLGIGMKFQTLIRDFAYICVPLFVMCTGFLNKKTKYDKFFFKGLVNVLIVYLFYSTIEFFCLNIIKGTTSNLNIRNFIFSITSFSACRYGWYIKMFVGLYLFSPLLNNGYESLDKKNRFYLLIITIFTLIVPHFVNKIFYGVFSLPNWWQSSYLIAYYITGKYISDTLPTFKKKNLILILIIMQIINVCYNYINPIEHITLTTFISTTTVFLLFYNIKLNNNIIKKIVKYFSIISLDIYLSSSLIDQIIYPIFNNKIISMGIKQPYVILGAPIILILDFVICSICSSIRKLIINVR